MSTKDRALIEQRLLRYQYRVAIRDVGGVELSRTLFEEAMNAYARHDYDRAIECLNIVLPPNPGASVSAALFHFFDGTHDEKNSPPWGPQETAEITNGFYYRGLAYKKKREWDKAIADLTTALWREPDAPQTLAERGMTYRYKGKTDWALRDFDEMIRRKPNDALGYALRADTLQMTKGWKAALEAADTALRLDPKLALAYEVRGRTYASRKEYDKADREFNEAQRLDPDQVKKILASAYAFEQKGDYKLAAADLREAAERFPRSDWAHNELAWFLATCPDAAYRDGKDAVAHGKLACELTKWSHAGRLDTLAAAYAEIGNFEQAVKFVREAIAKTKPLSADQKTFEEHLDLFQRNEACRERLETNY
jgi:tetratricopeptide (TPR) repeat protein